LDAARAGFRTTVVEDATRPVYREQVPDRRKQWEEAGVRVVQAAELLTGAAA
jgi:nicotinamidase-related amidase